MTPHAFITLRPDPHPIRTGCTVKVQGGTHVYGKHVLRHQPMSTRQRPEPPARSDRDLLDDMDLVRRLQDRYDEIAAADRTARHLQTTRRTPGELADRIIAMLPALAAPG